MRQSLSLIEVLISVMLISVVIVSMLQIKENNIHFIEKSKDSIKYNEYISMIAFDKSTNGKIYLSDKVNFKDDDIRRDLKNIKIEKKIENLESLEFSTDEYNLRVDIEEISFKIDKKFEKKFYRFSLVN